MVGLLIFLFLECNKQFRLDSLLNMKTEKTFNKITNRGKLVKIVREVYLREDIFCQSEACSTCEQEKKILPNHPLTKKQQMKNINRNDVSFMKKYPHYIIPTVEVTLKYSDLLFKSMKNLIFCETALNEAQNSNKSKLVARIRNFTSNSENQSIVFLNEHSIHTYVKRSENETITQRQDRAIATTAVWFYEHLQQRVPIIILSEQKIEKFNEIPGVKNITVEEYLKEWITDDSSILQNHYESLLSKFESLSINQDDDEFENHLNIETIEEGVKKALYYKGSLKVNKFNSKEAQLKISMKGMDDEMMNSTSIIHIHGRKNMNRAIHGDTVGVELLPENEWIDEIPCGKVVGIITRNIRDYVACIQIDKEKKSNSDYVLCTPLDYRIPFIRIKTKQKKNLENSRIIVRIISWEKNSNYPNGFYVKSLGDIGDLNIETEALLLENNISYESFSPSAIKELPTHSKEKPYQIPKEEFKKRKDMRKVLTMSIDPIGCVDIDDALSYKELNNGNIQIGVHIADVTAFVNLNSALDLEARKKSTTIYLIDRRLDMLPSLLSTDLCSLHQKQDRYAVSVIWEFTPEGTVKNQWFGRSVINSDYSLHYDQAQNLIDGRETEPIETKTGWKSCKIDEKDQICVKKGLMNLQKYARILKKQREIKGAVDLASLDEIQISLDNKSNPTKIETHDDAEIHQIVAEWMIFANHSVATRIYKKFPNAALLRKHPFPNQQNFDQLKKTAESKGFIIDTSSNENLSISLSKAIDEADPNVNLLLRSLATRAMSEAEYFSTGSFSFEDFYHYGLALQYYTHFTSPIRRYADVIVHRLLLSEKEIFENKELQEIADYMNDQHRSSKQVQMESNEWFSSMFFLTEKNKSLPIEEGIIYGMKSNSISIYVPKYRLKSNIFIIDKEGEVIIPQSDLNQLKNIKFCKMEFDQDSIKMIISLNNNKFVLKLFDHVKVTIDVNEFREHRPSIHLSLHSFEVLKLHQLNQLNPSKSEINKIYSDSNKIFGSKTKSVWEVKNLMDEEFNGKLSKKNEIFEILHEKEKKLQVYSDTIVVDFYESELKEKLKKIEKRLNLIDQLKKKQKLSDSELEKVKTEEKYKKALVQIKNKLLQ